MARASLRRTSDPDDPSSSTGLFGRASVLEHLEALRQCLTRSALAAGVGMLVAFFYIDHIFAFVFAPTRKMLPPGTTLVYTQPGEAFGLYINIALLAGAVLASPVISFFIWRLISPALYSRQKRFVVPFIGLTTIGGLGGAAFSHYILFPYMIAFFGTFATGGLQFMPQVSEVFGLYLKMLGAAVLIFQMPTFAFFTARMGVITAGLLWRHIRYAILVIFVIAAVITPSADPWTQAVFAAPMIVLYLLSVVIAWVAAPRKTPVAAGAE
ncbi:MAG: twin-arginine translocase subunit TatC [Vicinamibacterales bacterium]